MVQTEAREGQTLLLCQHDLPLKAALLIRPSRDMHLHGPLRWRIGASECRRTSGQCLVPGHQRSGHLGSPGEPWGSATQQGLPVRAGPAVAP